MRLKKNQREALLSWIAEGLTSKTINERASKFEPPYSVTRQNVDQYRKRYGVQLAEMSKAADFAALHEGLSRKETRVLLLHRLAETLVSDIFDKKLLWVSMVKGIGSQGNYERVEYVEFNKAEIDALRGVLDDIAQEIGDRTPTEPPPVNLHLAIDGLQAVMDKVYGDPQPGVETSPVTTRLLTEGLQEVLYKAHKPATDPLREEVKPLPTGKMTAEEWNKLTSLSPNEANALKARRT